MSKRRLLLLTFYFPPDLAACSFRAGPLLDALLESLPTDMEIDVISTMPNRYHGFTPETAVEERHERHNIHRIQLPPHKSGMFDQSRAFVRFWRNTMRITRGRQYDMIIATSSRLMTAVLGARIARRKKAPLYLDIRDIFVDTIREVLPKWSAIPLSPFLKALETWTIRQALHVNLVSRGFASYFESQYPAQSFSYFTNGIDDEFLRRGVAAAREGPEPGRPVRVLYAGNIGDGQGLHAIIPELARRLAGRAIFRLIGDGGRRTMLASALAESRIKNVEIVAPMSRSRLVHEYLAADVLFLHLNDYAAFRKVLPSKLFEYAAMGKPILAGVAGYPADFIKSEIGNAAVFPPCDVEAAMRAFESLDLRCTHREVFVGKYARRNIMRALATDILRRLAALPVVARA